MALLTLLFQLSYTVLENLCQKISNYTTISVTLPYWLKNLFTDLHFYFNYAIVTLSTLTVYLYDNNAP